MTLPFGKVSCSADSYCKTPPGDVCAALVDLSVGDEFTVVYNNKGSDHSAQTEFQAVFERGDAGQAVQATGGGKHNTTTLFYDGECALFVTSAYCCNDTDYSHAAVAITDVSYGPK